MKRNQIIIIVGVMTFILLLIIGMKKELYVPILGMQEKDQKMLQYKSSEEIKYKDYVIKLDYCIYDKYTKVGRCILTVVRKDGTKKGLSSKSECFGENKELRFED